MESSKTLDLKRLLEVYRDTLAEDRFNQLVFANNETPSELQALATRMLKTFLESAFSAPDGIVRGVGQILTGDLADQGPELCSHLDVLIENEREFRVLALMISRCRWSSVDVAANEDQLLLSHELLRNVEFKPVSLQFVVLTRTKDPKIESWDVIPDRRKVDRLRGTIRNAWEVIQAQHFYPVLSVINCTSCGHRQRCSAWSG